MYKEHLIVLNVLNNSVTTLATNVTQNDANTNAITVMLRGLNDKPFDITEATSISVSIVKPNGNLETIQQGINLEIVDREKGKVKVILTELAVTVCGICQATVDIFKGENRLTSSRFAYNVVSDIANDVNADNIEESSISQLITATEQAKTGAEAATQAANTATSNANTAVSNIPNTVNDAIKNNTYATLNTTAKTVIGGINENKASITAQSQQINVLNSDRGYLNSVTIITDFNLANKNGKYVLFNGSLNAPFTSSSYAIAVDVTTQTSDTFTQTAKVIWGTNAGCIYTRECASGVFQPWQQIATTTKTVNKTATTYSITNGSSITIPFNRGNWYIAYDILTIGGTESCGVYHINWINQYAKLLTKISRLDFGSGSLVTFNISDTGVVITNGLNSPIQINVTVGGLT